MNIPLIKILIGLWYPVVNYQAKYEDSTTINLAKGEIEKFNFHESFQNQTPIGKRVSRSMGKYDTIWVSLGDDYFKLISKT